MKRYVPEKLAAISRYRKHIPTLPEEIRRDVYARIGELIREEKKHCAPGNTKHIFRSTAWAKRRPAGSLPRRCGRR